MNNIDDKLKFVFKLRQAGVTNTKVLETMEGLARENFLDGTFKKHCHQDIALPIACGQTTSQPSVVGIMIQSLDVNSRCKILEIGTGSGYQTAILSRLCRRVYSFEIHKDLSSFAEKALININISNVTMLVGDGTSGFQAQAPFDRIIVSAALEDPPRILLDQLKPEGIMILPVGRSDNLQKLIKVQRNGKNFSYKELRDVRFVPMMDSSEVLEKTENSALKFYG